MYNTVHSNLYTISRPQKKQNLYCFSIKSIIKITKTNYFFKYD